MASPSRHSTQNEEKFGQGYDFEVSNNEPTTAGDVIRLSSPDHESQSLHRGLKARHVSMIAIGGAIGTGLVIGTGQTLANGGPGSLFIAYSIVGMLVYVVMAALGEMATWLPVAGGFTPYATRFVDPALGFATGYTHWLKYLITCANQLTAGALVIQYWLPREKVNPGVWIAIFLVAIIAINILGVKFFGDSNSGFRASRYWRNPGAFREYRAQGDLGCFIAVWSSLVNAVFAYLGTELVGVTVGEAQNPRRNIPKAIKLTFWRIMFFYIVSVLLLGMNVPYNSAKLVFATKQSSSAAASPFVVAIGLAGISFLPGFINACILIFVFSAANSDLYTSSRTIHGLATKKQAPAFLGKTDSRGVPYYAIGLSAAISCVSFLNVSTGSATVFTYFVNLASICGLMVWISILVSHLAFIRARNAQGVDPKSLRYRSPFGFWGSSFALGFCILIAFTKNFTVFIHSPKTYGDFDYKDFITGYLGIPIYLGLLFGWKVWAMTKRVKESEADIWTGKDVIDADERMWLEKEAADRANGRRPHVLYRYTLGLLF
ncbi:hypothetical protein PRZ48_009825 [Zasmidium cellare]|uniref:Amino acid permease/ SLC12A domain-containing protein n=1 Tax=Zasmidium cellare TaxID=395010 RepID=A0ABR0ECW8_ZASCE|nr:hypothetical protein PRZ48_009825 [Zasmidium cellare]